MHSTLISRVRPIAISMVLLVALGACVGTASPGWTFAPPPATASASASASASGGSAAPSGSPAGSASAGASGSPAASGASGSATVNLKAASLAWDPKDLKAPADKAFQIVVDNQDAGVPHDLQINDASGQQVFKGDQVTGVGTKTYDVPALKAGTYPFKCLIHPTMTGTLTVQ